MAPGNPRIRPVSIYEKFHAALVQVHRELAEGVAKILESAPDPANDAATDRIVMTFTETLFGHHKAEDAFFFPAFRSAGRLRSSDVAFLAARDAEHADIHRLCEDLKKTSGDHLRGALSAAHWRGTLMAAASELGALSTPHFELEESTLTAAHLATLISVPELVQVYRDMGQNWNRR